MTVESGVCVLGIPEYSVKAVDRLAAYEETGLEPEEVRRCLEFEDICLDEYIRHERLHELAQADREGAGVRVLPCKVGDKLYEAIRHRNPEKWKS